MSNSTGISSSLTFKNNVYPEPLLPITTFFLPTTTPSVEPASKLKLGLPSDNFNLLLIVVTSPFFMNVLTFTSYTLSLLLSTLEKSIEPLKLPSESFSIKYTLLFIITSTLDTSELSSKPTFILGLPFKNV